MLKFLYVKTLWVAVVFNPFNEVLAISHIGENIFD